MRFMVKRRSCISSDEYKDARPCDGVVKGEYIYTDVRYTDTPEHVPYHMGKSDWWYEQGTNHRLINGNIARDLKVNGWILEVSSLEELIAFKQKVGSPIVIWDVMSDLMLIEIDDYANDKRIEKEEE